MEVTERQEMTSFQRLSKYGYKAEFSIASHHQPITSLHESIDLPSCLNK